MRQNHRVADIIGLPGLATACTDIASVVLAALIAIPVANYGDSFGPVHLPLGDHYRLAIVTTAFLAATVFFWSGAYRPWRGSALLAELRVLFFGWLAVFLVLAGATLATKTGAMFSRQWVASWFCIGLLQLSFLRVLLRFSLNTLRRRGYDQKDIVLVGGGDLAERVVRQLRKNNASGLNVAGYFDDRDCGILDDQAARLGGIDDVLDYLKKAETRGSRIDQVWLAMALSKETRMQDVLQQLQQSTVDVRLVPDLFGYQLLNHSVQHVAGLSVINLSVSPMDEINRFLKRVEDILLGTMMLFSTLPVMLVIAGAIRLSSPGPILFRQRRHGWDGREFEIFKFRTMKIHKPPSRGTYIQATPHDGRVTPVGRWLRCYSLDELPQVFNVLRGDMSIVGPRPQPVEQNHQFMSKVDGYMRRHKVKPGITGWAQINGLRGMTDTLEKMEARVEHDIYYIENWSLAFDLKIVFLSLFKGFRNVNAH